MIQTWGGETGKDPMGPQQRMWVNQLIAENEGRFIFNLSLQMIYFILTPLLISKARMDIGYCLQQLPRPSTQNRIYAVRILT